MASTMLNQRENRHFLVLLIMSMVFISTLADLAKDREECTPQLAGMATCLPYLGDDEKAPTPDCCNALEEVLKNNKKCLCVVIRDLDAPDFDLQLNASLALSLPNVCNAPANVSKCPELLNLPPNSPEAQVFYQLGNGSSTPVGSSDAPGPGPGDRISARGNSKGAKLTGPEKGEASMKQKRRLAMETVLIGGVLLWVFG